MKQIKRYIELDPIKIDREEFYTVKQFAYITNRSEQNVRYLIRTGNRIRKLLHMKIGHQLLIYTHELTDFPFTECGPSDKIYHYDKNGRVTEEEIVEV